MELGRSCRLAAAPLTQCKGAGASSKCRCGCASRSEAAVALAAAAATAGRACRLAAPIARCRSGDWRCSCGSTLKLWDNCACGQPSPCRCAAGSKGGSVRALRRTAGERVCTACARCAACSSSPLTCTAAPPHRCCPASPLPAGSGCAATACCPSAGERGWAPPAAVLHLLCRSLCCNCHALLL